MYASGGRRDRHLSGPRGYMLQGYLQWRKTLEACRVWHDGDMSWQVLHNVWARKKKQESGINQADGEERPSIVAERVCLGAWYDAKGL